MAKYDEAYLDQLINEILDNEFECDDYPHVCSIMSTNTGRKKIFDEVKRLCLAEGVYNIYAAIGRIETEIKQAEQNNE